MINTHEWKSFSSRLELFRYSSVALKKKEARARKKRKKKRKKRRGRRSSKRFEERVYVWNKRSFTVRARFFLVHMCSRMYTLLFLSLPPYTWLECAFTQLTSLPLLVFLFSRPSSFAPPRFPSLFAGSRRSFCFSSSRIGPRIVSRRVSRFKLQFVCDRKRDTQS